MFRVTLVNLDDDVTHATPDSGSCEIAEVRSDEVIDLLERFCAVDAVENLKSDPEIIFEYRRNKYVVRTGQGRLHLYDPRRPLEPALVLTPAEVLAEIDGSAAAARRRASVAAAEWASSDLVDLPSAPPPRAALRLPHRIAFVAAAVCFGGYTAYCQFSAARSVPPVTFEPVSDPREVEAYRSDYAGVYMTGSQPGHHGIALNADGTMKLFQVNPQGPPGLIQDTYRLGRVDGHLCALGTQRGGEIGRAHV